MASKVTFYRDDDTLRVDLADAPFGYTREYGETRHVFFSTTGQPISVEFLFVSEGIDLSDLPARDLINEALRSVRGIKIAA